MQEKKQISVFSVPHERHGSTKITIHWCNRGGRYECKREAEPVACGINVAVLLVDYVAQFHFVELLSVGIISKIAPFPKLRKELFESYQSIYQCQLTVLGQYDHGPPLHALQPSLHALQPSLHALRAHV